MDIFKKIGNFFVDVLETIAVALSLFVLIYATTAQPHKVQGDSMLPNFHNNSLLLTDKLTYKFNEPQRGDVVVFHFPKDPRYDYIKRIIALPGETIKIENNQIIITSSEQPHGFVLNETYLAPDAITQGKKYLPPGQSTTISSGEYFVIGDNREASSDSREWGTIEKKDLVGRAFIVYWPPEDIGLVKNPLDTTTL